MVWMGKRRRRRRRRERWRERMRKGARKYHPLPTKICLERSAHTLCTYFITTQMHEGFVYLLKALLHSRTIHRSGKRRLPKKTLSFTTAEASRGGGSRREGEGCFMSLFLLFPGREEQPPKQAPQPSPQPPIDVGTERGGAEKRGGEARPSVPLPFIQFSSSLLHPAGGGGWRWRGREGGRMGGRGFPFCPPLQLFLF